MIRKQSVSTRIAAGLAAALFLVLLWPNEGAFAGPSNTPREDTWVTNGWVDAIVTTPVTTYIGGIFTYVGPCTGHGVPVDAGTGAPVGVYPKVNGEVRASVPDDVGGWYIGGTFTQVGTVARNNIAHILSDGTADPTWNPNADGDVYALAVSGTTVYAGGYFTSIGGQTRNYIAALDSGTGLATAWNPHAGGDLYSNNSVDILAVSGTTVYAGGGFTTIGGQTRNHIAALDATTGLATAWNPNAGGGTYYTTVGALAVSGTTVYAGGGFTTIGGQTRNYIAALDAETGLATAWDPNANDGVSTLAVSGTTVYAGGGFSTIGGQTRNHVAALDAGTGLANAWNPNADSNVYTLSVSGTTVYAGGGFSTIGGQTRNNIAALDAGTGLAKAWDPNANDRVFTLAVRGTMVYVGGDFNSVGGQTRNCIAALDTGTGLATTWNPNAISSGPFCTVSALAVSGTTVYAGGNFTSIGGQTRNHIAALDTGTGLASAWNPNADNSVLALAVSGTTVYVGGYFTSIGGQPRNCIAALDTGMGLATTSNPNAVLLNGTPSVHALAVSGTTVYAGGGFTSIGGQPRNNIAALDTETGLATTWNPNAGGGGFNQLPTVGVLAVSGTTVYAGGAFTSIGGQPRNNIAALDTETGLATAWNPNAGGGLYSDNSVDALAVSGTTVYAGGGFTTIGGQPQNYIAALDAGTGLATAWNPYANDGSPNSVYALAVSGTTVYAGGYFSTIGGQSRGWFAEFVDDIMPGSLKVTLLPAAAATAGAQWSIDSGATWNNSGATVGNIAAGNVTVTFKGATGWTKPTDKTAAITAGNTTSLAATFTSLTAEGEGEPAEGEGEGESTPPTEAQLQDLLTASFDTVDTNGDGQISFAEALAALPGLTQAVFNAMDSSGDGLISRTEAAVVEGEGEGEGGGGGCTGCSGGKGAFGFDGLKDSLGSLFLGALSVMALLALAGRRP